MALDEFLALGIGFSGERFFRQFSACDVGKVGKKRDMHIVIITQEALMRCGMALILLTTERNDSSMLGCRIIIKISKGL